MGSDALTYMSGLAQTTRNRRPGDRGSHLALDRHQHLPTFGPASQVLQRSDATDGTKGVDTNGARTLRSGLLALLLSKRTLLGTRALLLGANSY